MPWLVPVPSEHQGGTYLDLVKAWVQGAEVAIPLGVRRALYPNAARGMDRELGYVITNPTATFVLLPTDEVYVLASLAFGQRMLGDKFLRESSCRDELSSEQQQEIGVIEAATAANDVNLMLKCASTKCSDVKSMLIDPSKYENRPDRVLDCAIGKLEETVAMLKAMRDGEYTSQI